MVLHDVKPQVKLPKVVAMDGVTLVTTYLCLKVMNMSKENLGAEPTNEVFYP